MEIIAGTTDFYLEKDTAVAIGKFDGVHLGHRRLLEEILGRKKYGLAARKKDACLNVWESTL